MAAWRLAALVVRLPGKFIPRGTRGTGLLIAGLVASIASMIFDRVAKVDVMMSVRMGLLKSKRAKSREPLRLSVAAATAPVPPKSTCARGRRRRRLTPHLFFGLPRRTDSPAAHLALGQI
jgi:hypothetical protein